jgi:hypothetical protein
VNLHTDLYRATPPAVVATVPLRRRGTRFVAVTLAALLAVGAGVAVTELVDHGSGSVASTSTPAATVPSTADAQTLWTWLAELPAADRYEVMAAIIPDIPEAIRAIVAGMVPSTIR